MSTIIQTSGVGAVELRLASVSVDLDDDSITQTIYQCPADRRAIVTRVVIRDLSTAPADALGHIGWNVGANDFIPVINFAAAFALGPTSVLLPNVGGDYMSPNVAIGAAGDTFGFSVGQENGAPLTCFIDAFGYLTDMAGIPV